MVTYQSGRAEVKCPFCGKEGIPAFHRPAHKVPHVSRIAGKSATTYHFEHESYEINSDCPKCGAKQKDIQKHYNGEVTEKKSHEDRVKRLKDAGLPTQIRG